MPKQPKRKGAETIKFGVETIEPEAPSRRFASLVIVQGAEADLGVHVMCDGPIVIGRDPGAELPLRDGSCSRRHCQVERDPATGFFVVQDLGSTNGVVVNGVKISSPVALAEGDKIFLGSSIVKFTYTDEYDQEYLARLDSLVSTDPLTGLMTRRRFDAVFEQAMEAARQDGSPLAVLVVDMDGLKTINDTHGHESGGFAIVEVAKLLRDALAMHGPLCRYGGDEFMAFLPGFDKQEALELAEVVRKAVADGKFIKDGVVLHPTLSIGVSARPEDGEQALVLFRAADRALYQAKAAGKNRVVAA